jgi:hypothetical protein
MRIDGIGGPVIGPASRRATAERREPDTSEARALIAIAPAAPSERMPAMTRHPAAPFLAQLIATRMQAPQTRARRRAGPAEAAAAYSTAMAPRPAFHRRQAGKRA